MSKIFITGGTVIDPSSQRSGRADLVIENGKVLGVEDSVSVPSDAESAGDKIIKADGLWVVPGLIDVHVHLREPGQEWKETIATGAKAGIAGGYTSLLCMPNTEPAIHSAEVTEFILKKAVEASMAKVFPIGAVSHDRKGEHMAPLLELAEAGCVAFSDDGDPVWNAGLMRRALQMTASTGMPICCHEEDCSITCDSSGDRGAMDECGRSFQLGIPPMPAIAEEVLIARDIELARDTGGYVHICHVSTARGALLVRRAKEDGIKVTAEVTPHHLHLTHNDVDGVDTNYKMSPPLRAPEDVEALREGLADGTIDLIASDHAPHERDSKECEFTAASLGITGLQTNLSLTLELVQSGAVTRERAIDALSSRAAKLFQLGTGSLQKGAPADVAIFNAEEKWEFQEEDNLSKSVNTPFFGRSLPGTVHSVVVDGELKFSAGTFVEKG